jgi:hypothetical protein
MFRIRYDDSRDINRPDRATYFYATWQELGFHPHGVNGGGTFFDPGASGPVILPQRLDAQELSAYFELAFSDRLSAFVNIPLRYVDFDNLVEDNPESESKRNPKDFPAPGSPFFPEPERGAIDSSPHTNFFGLSDIQAGFKYALIAAPDEYLTFQLRVYTPTGDGGKGLGTDHVSLEPGLLLYRQIDRWQFQSEFKVWVPIGGGPAEGEVLNYGLGLGYDIYRCGRFRVTPITEFVGWTVLNGFESVFGTINATPPAPNFELPRTHGVVDASGDTIVNGKFGVRTYFGAGSDVYVGYGHALTGDRWYKDILRVEYRISF